MTGDLVHTDQGDCPVKYIPALLIATILSVSPAVSRAAEFTDAQKDEMQIIIKDYLMNNPAVLIDSLEQYRMQQEQAMVAEQNAKLNEHKEALFSKDAPSVGDADGDITMVEFFDYNCGYCKRALPDVQKLMQSDPKVRIVFKEMPILGPSSTEAAKWALAAHKQGNDKYFSFHTALMEANGEKTEATLEKLAKDAGLDVEKVKKDKEDPAIMTAINTNHDIAQQLGISGTPGFVINDEIFRGYITHAQMEEKIKSLRAAKSAE